MGNNEFISINIISRTASLAIVAPGIAEALFATALGLLAAIPAVVATINLIAIHRNIFQELKIFLKDFYQ